METCYRSKKSDKIKSDSKGIKEVGAMIRRRNELITGAKVPHEMVLLFITCYAPTL
jgi:hypothetical protein